MAANNKMGILTVFKLSLLLPQKQAVYQLNRVKTKDFFLYIFLMHLVLSLPNGIVMVVDFIEKDNFDRTILFVGILYPILVIMTGTLGISLLAAIGIVIRIVTKRKLVYQLLWKMAMYASTIPVLLYTIINVFYKTDGILNALLLLVLLYIFSKMIVTYPKMRT